MLNFKFYSYTPPPCCPLLLRRDGFEAGWPNPFNPHHHHSWSSPPLTRLASPLLRGVNLKRVTSRSFVFSQLLKMFSSQSWITSRSDFFIFSTSTFDEATCKIHRKITNTCSTNWKTALKMCFFVQYFNQSRQSATSINIAKGTTDPRVGCYDQIKN